MKDFEKALSLVYIPGGHGVILCYNLQFSRWFIYIDIQTENLEEEDANDPMNFHRTVQTAQIHTSECKLPSKPIRSVIGTQLHGRDRDTILGEGKVERRRSAAC